MQYTGQKHHTAEKKDLFFSKHLRLYKVRWSQKLHSAIILYFLFRIINLYEISCILQSRSLIKKIKTSKFVAHHRFLFSLILVLYENMSDNEGMACSMHGGEEKCIKNFGGKSRMK